MARIKKIATELQVKDKLLDYSGDAGTSGQLLSSTGTGTNWITFSGVTASNGSSGRAAFFTGSTTIQGSDNFYWDNSNARLGIGTTSPGNKLHVNGGEIQVVNGTYGKLLLQNSTNYVYGDQNGVAIINANNNLRLYTVGSERLRINSSGNIGIGTTSPAKQLTISSTTPFIRLEENQSGGNKRLDLWVDQNAVAHIDANQSASQITLRTASTDRLRITNAGNVGIGTTSPSVKFEVNGGADAVAKITGTTTAARFDYATNSHHRFWQIIESDGRFRFYDQTNTAERLTITSSGNIGIGATDPLRKLHVVGNMAVNAGTDEYYGILMQGGESADPKITIGDWHNSSATIKWDSTGNYLRIDSQHATSNAPIIFSGNDSSTEYMRIDSSGRVGIGTAVPGTNLDIQGVGAQSLRVKSDSSATIIIDSDGDNDGTAGSYLHYRDTGTTKWTLYKETNNDFYLHNAAASKYPIHAKAGGDIVLMEDGNNLGVGASSPTEKLHVEGRIRIGTTPVICSHGNITMDIDQDNNSGSNYFRVTRDGEVTELFKVQEDGNSTFAGRITTTQNQITTNIATTSAIRLQPGSTTNTTGKTSIFLGTSPVDNYGISLRGARLGTDGTPTFELATHFNSANGTVALSIDNSQNTTFANDITTPGTINLPGNGNTATRETLMDAHGTRGKLMKEGNAVYWQVAQGSNQFEITDGANGNSTKGNVLLRTNGHDDYDNKLILVPNGGTVGINTPVPFTANANADELVVGSGSGNQGITIYSGDSNNGSIYFADDLDEEGAGDNPAGNRDGVILYSHGNARFDFKTGGNQQALRLTNSSATFAGNVTVTGNLTVDGTTTTLNTQTVEVEDNIIQLNTTQGSPDTATAATSGISVYRGDGVTQASFIFDDGDDTWDLTNNLTVAGSVSASRFQGTTYPYNTTVGHTANATTTYIVAGSTSQTSIELSGGDANSNIIFKTPNSSNVETTALTLDTSQNATFAGDVRLPNSGKLYLWNDHDSNYLMYDRWRASASAGMNIQNVASTGEIYLRSNNALTLTLDGTGQGIFENYLGIGGNTPTVALDVKGTTNLASRFIFTKDQSTDRVLFGGADHDDFDTFVGSSSNHSFTITQNGAAAITIDTSKNATFAGNVKAETLELHDINGNVSSKFKIYGWDDELQFTKRNLSTGAHTGTLLALDYSDNSATFAGDITVEGGQIYINDANTKLEEGTGNAFRVTTDSGYIDIGPKNTGHCHIETDRTNFYFNKYIRVDSGIISSYDEDLSLRRAAADAGSVNLNIGMLYSKSVNDSQVQLGGFTLNTALEDTYHVYMPGVSPNAFGGATKRLTVAATKNGTTISNSTLLNAFLAHEDTVSISTTNTDTIIIEISGFSLNYGQWYGIAFGAAQWRAKDIDIEISSDNGVNYTSIYSENNQPHSTVRTYHSGGSTIVNKIKYTLTNWNTTSTRINHIFGYKYLQADTNYLDKYMNSSIYASINFKDDYPATFGNSGDLVIKHTGSNSIIETHATDSTGDLYIKSQGTDHDLYLQAADNILIQPQGSENGIRVHGNDNVELYFNNVRKLRTTNTGINVEGEVVATTLDTSGDVTVNGGDIYIALSGSTQRAVSSTGTNSMQIGDAGTQMLRFKNAAGVSLDIAADGNATFAGYVSAATGFRMASGQAIDFIDSNIGYNSIERDTTNGGLQINTGGTASLNILDNGNATFAGDVTIGTTSSQKALKLPNNGEIQLFNTNDDAKFTIRNIGSAQNTFAIETNNGTDALTIDSTGAATFSGSVEMASGKITSDGSATAGAYLELKHANNNSTDVCATINLTNNVGGYAAIVGGTTGANNTGYIEFKTDNAGTQGTVLTLNGDNSAAFAGNIGVGNPTALTHAININVPNNTTKGIYFMDGGNDHYGTKIQYTESTNLFEIIQEENNVQTGSFSIARSTGNATFSSVVKADGGNVALGNISGVARLQHEGSGQLKMLSSGDSHIATFTSTGTTFAGSVHLDSDSAQLQFGDDNDMQMFHNGANGEINIGTGSFTIDSAGDITLDAGGNDIFLSNAGTQYGYFKQYNQGVGLYVSIQDKDFVVRGNDGGTTITAFGLDMSEGGKATFASTVRAALGNKGEPSYSFTGDTNTGMFSDSADTLEFAAGGNSMLNVNVDAGKVGVVGSLTVSSNIEDRNIPCLFNSNFEDAYATTIIVVPFNNNTENNVSSRTYNHNLTMPYAGKLTKIVMKHVSGTLSSGFTTQLFLYVNGSQQASSSEISLSNDSVTWTPTTNNTFSAGDILSFGYQKSALKTFGGVSFGVAIELTDYDI